MPAAPKTARILIALGCLILLLGSTLHLLGGYPQVVTALASASNLDAGVRNALRAVFLMIAITWMIVAVVTLIAAFAKPHRSKLIILVCGFALLLEIPIWVGLMGWFIGNEMFLLAAALIVCGGLLFRDPRSA